MKFQQSYGTGDINLAAAIMTMGVPPNDADPVKLIACENGKDYVRFHLKSHSIDGRITTESLMNAWSDPATFKMDFPTNPFCVVMDFIATRPAPCSNPDHWLDHAAGFLGMPIDAVKSLFLNVKATCKASPESPASYVVAFIRNRFDLVGIAKRNGDQGRFKNMQTHGSAFGLIPAKAPKRIRDYLLSALRQ